MPDHPVARNSVEVLAEEFIERYRRGERPPLKEYTDRYPELAEQIEDLFPALLMMENLKPAEADQAAAARNQARDDDLGHLGDYRIIREVGRGGMGIVYEAEQVSLGRRVALKVLPEEMFENPKQRWRFEREAKAAARLHHTNIVPVFGVGEDNATGYYVMQFIQGLPLDDVLDELKRLRAKSGSSGAPFETGELKVGRHDPSATRMAISLMTGAFKPGAAEEATDAGIARTPDKTVAAAPLDDKTSTQAGDGPRSDETVADQPETPSPAPLRADPSPVSGRLADSFSLSSSSVVLPGAGRSRSERINRKRTYWHSVAQIGIQVADALAYAHGQGVLHRDIKPSNLLLDTRGTVWVTDFGLAKIDDDRGVTQTGDIVGTLRYMAPERFKGEADARSDLYSLGLSLYEFVAFRPAFKETNRNMLVEQVMNASVERLGKRNPEVPSDLRIIVHKAIERDAADRYQTAQELADDLERFLDDEPIRARPISPLELLARWSRHNKGLAASLAVITALVVCMAIGSTVVAGYFRRVASEKSNLAEYNRLLAIDEEAERRRAEGARTEALAAKREIERQNAEITQQRERAEENLYAARIALAENHLSSADFIGARRSLAAASPEPGQPDRRGWEWYYLDHWSNSAARSFKDHSGPAYAVAFSPDGRLLASAGGGNPYYANPQAVISPGEVLLRDFATGRVLHKLKGHKNIVTALAFSPDGKVLATGGHDATVTLWDVATGVPRQTFPAPHAQHEAGAVGFAPGGRHLCASWVQYAPLSGPDVSVSVVWSLGPRRQVHSLTTTNAGFCHDGSELYFVDPKPSQKVQRLNLASLEVSDLVSMPIANSQIWGLAESSGGRYLAVVTQWHALVWDLLSKQLIQQLPVPHGTERVVISPDEQLFCTFGRSNAVRVFETASGQTVATLLGHSQKVAGAVFSPDSRWLATSSFDGGVRIFPARRNPRGLSIRTEETQIAAVRFSSDGAEVQTAGWIGSRAVEAWDARTGLRSFTHRLAVAKNRVWPRGDFAFSRDGRLLAAPTEEDSRVVAIWDAKSGKKVVALARQPSTLTALAFSQGGALLATAYFTPFGGHFQLWEAATGKPVGPPRTIGHFVSAIAFSHDDKRLAVGGQPWLSLLDAARSRTQEQAVAITLSRPSVTIWNLEAAGEKIELLESLQSLALAFSPDDRQLAAADYLRSQVHIWDLEQQKKIGDLTNIPNACDVAYSPDGTRLAAIGYEATVHVWNARTLEELFALHTMGPASGSLGFTPRVAFSPDGSQIAGNSPHGIVTVWDAGVGFANRLLQQLVTEAETEFEHRDYRRAAAAAKSALEQKIASRPGRRLHARAWTVLADCRSREGDTGGAEKNREPARAILKELIAKDPADTELVTALASNVLQSNLMSKEDRDSYAEILRRSAENQISRGQFTNAGAVYARLAEFQPESAAWKGLRELTNDNVLPLLENPSNWGPGGTAVWQTVATHLTSRKMWPQAAAAQERLIELAPQDTYSWLHAAPVVALAGEPAAYRNLCQRMVAQFRESETVAEGERVIKVCLLIPGSIPTPESEVLRLKNHLAGKDAEPLFRPWGYATLALDAWRSGDAPAASKWARLSLESYPASPPEYLPPARALALTLQAIAEHMLGKAAAARVSLKAAGALIAPALDQFRHDVLPVGWHDWLIAEILRREADRLLQAPADGSAIKISPTGDAELKPKK
jgi:serine/threonine protein kinase/WD40 repeat protein